MHNWTEFLQVNIPDDATCEVVMGNYEQLQAEGAIGSCLLRNLAHDWHKNLGVNLGIATTMKDIAMHCYAILAHKYLASRTT